MAAEVDYVVDLNNCLQKTSQGNVAHELAWAMTQDGPNNKAVHQATANFRGVTLGEGKGITKGLAKRAAAEKALIYLGQNPLPPPQA